MRKTNYTTQTFTPPLPMLTSASAEQVALDAAALVGAEVDYPLFSLHAAQMCSPATGRWMCCPGRLFLQQSPNARIVALCGTTSRLFETTTYDNYAFRLGEQEFAGRRQLLDYLVSQYALLTTLLDRTGALLLGVDGTVEVVAPEAVAPADGPVLSLSQMQKAVDGWIDIHTWSGEPTSPLLTDTSLVFNADAKFTGAPINALATACWFQIYPLSKYTLDFIVGDVLLVQERVLRDEAEYEE